MKELSHKEPIRPLSVTNFNPYVTACNLFDILIEEIKFYRSSRKYLSREESTRLFRRYGRWTKNQRFHRYLYARTMENVVAHISESPGSLSILDLGCGFGSESLLFGLLGSKVTGVDLAISRISIANKRKRYYKEKLQRKIDVSFIAENVLRYASDSKFDVIFCREVISHVYPLSAFFRAICNLSKPGGLTIILDANPLNPHAAYKAWLAHRHQLIFYVEDPKSKEKVPYAEERLVHVMTIKNASYFDMRQMNFHCFLPFYVPFIKLLEDLANKIPIFKFIGRSYEVVATPLTLSTNDLPASK